MQVAVLILFATRELGLSAGAIGLAYMFGGAGCVLAAAFAERLSKRYGVGPVIVLGLMLTVVGWVLYGLIGGPGVVRDDRARRRRCSRSTSAACCTASTTWRLRQAITPDRLLGRMTATMRFLTVAAAPLGSLVGGALATVIGLRGTLWTIGVLGRAARRRRDRVVAGAAPSHAAGGCAGRIAARTFVAWRSADIAQRLESQVPLNRRPR